MVESILREAKFDTLERIVVGRINGVFGVRGQLKVFSYTEPIENIFSYVPWWLGSGSHWEARKLIRGQKHIRGLIVSLEGCQFRDQALALAGKQVAILREQLPETAENEFYWSDLIGLTVSTGTGVQLGVVDYLFETGANDVLVVKGDRQRLIPYIWKQTVWNVDLDGGTITVDWDPEF